MRHLWRGAAPQPGLVLVLSAEKSSASRAESMIGALLSCADRGYDLQQQRLQPATLVCIVAVKLPSAWVPYWRQRTPPAMRRMHQ